MRKASERSIEKVMLSIEPLTRTIVDGLTLNAYILDMRKPRFVDAKSTICVYPQARSITEERWKEQLQSRTFFSIQYPTLCTYILLDIVYRTRRPRKSTLADSPPRYPLTYSQLFCLASFTCTQPRYYFEFFSSINMCMYFAFILLPLKYINDTFYYTIVGRN